MTTVHYTSFFPTGSSGSVSFTVNNQLQPLILTVTGTHTGGELAITLERGLRIGSSINHTNEKFEENDQLLAFVLLIIPCFIHFISQSVCSLHLINDGVTVTGDTVTVEWQETGPTAANWNTEFNCRLGNEGFQSCE